MARPGVGYESRRAAILPARVGGRIPARRRDLRRRPGRAAPACPRFLTWLGLVSYSLYLLHPLWIDLYAHLPWAHARHTPALAAAFMAVLLVCCQLTYRCVELPGQRLGTRLARRLDSPPPPTEPGGPGTLVSLPVPAPAGQRKGRKPSSR